ncbi:MAG: carbon starvation CstA 5TM domain-containing protein, partial [bacterium]|nr:carbon starvation CstA 5TM domain-containing protein [bacterium]
ITIILPLVFSLIDIKDANGNIIPAYRAIWPVFGASNQLLAALVLLVMSVWLIKTNKNPLLTALPMLFMLAVTLFALFQLIMVYKLTAVGMIAIALFLLALYFLFSSLPVLKLIAGSRKQQV